MAKEPLETVDGNDPTTSSQIFGLAVPALGALLIDPLLQITDTALVGRYSDTADALAGMGSVVPLLTFSFYIFNFFCTATTPLVASRRAAGNEEEAVRVGSQALSLSLFLGGVLSGVLIAFQGPLLGVMGTDITGEVVNGYASDFLSVRALAAPAVLSISAATGVLRGYLDTKTPIVILILANLVNLGLDLLLIPDLGLKGAAIATTTAEWISALSFLGILTGQLPTVEGQLGSNRPDKVRFTPSLSVPAWADIQPLVVASSSVLLRSLLLQASISSAAALAARTGAASLAAHQIGLQLWLLCSEICDALAAASQALVADALGRSQRNEARAVSSTIFFYALLLGLVLGITLEIGSVSGVLLDSFTRDAATQTELTRVLAIIVLAQPLNSLVFAADGVLQGASQFSFQAKAMSLSVAVTLLFYTTGRGGEIDDSLVHIWQSLVVLQLMRGLTSFYKLVDKDGPINMWER